MSEIRVQRACAAWQQPSQPPPRRVTDPQCGPRRQWWSSPRAAAALPRTPPCCARACARPSPRRAPPRTRPARPARAASSERCVAPAGLACWPGLVWSAEAVHTDALRALDPVVSCSEWCCRASLLPGHRLADPETRIVPPHEARQRCPNPQRAPPLRAGADQCRVPGAQARRRHPARPLRRLDRHGCAAARPGGRRGRRGAGCRAQCGRGGRA